MSGTSARTQDVATFPVSAGDVVLRDRPWIYSLFLDKIPHCCYRCFTPFHPEVNLDNNAGVPNGETQENGVDGHGHGSIVECTGCGIPRYCSTKCQTDDIDCPYRHGGECKILQALKAKNIAPTHDLMMLLKGIFRLKLEETGDFPAGRQLCTPPNERTYNRLLSHTDELSDPEPRLEHVDNLHQSLAAVLSESDLPDLHNLVEMHWKTTVNSFDIRTPYLQRIGEGLYLGASEFDHSCQRNVIFYFEGTSIVMKATAPIAKWTDVRVSYTEIFTPTTLRIQNLEEWFYFRCGCHLCADDTGKDLKLQFTQCCKSQGSRQVDDNSASTKSILSDGMVRSVSPPSTPPNTPNILEKAIKISASSQDYDWSDFNWHDNSRRRPSLREASKRTLPFDFEEYANIERLTRNQPAVRELQEAEKPCRKILEATEKVLPPDAIARSLIHATLAKVLLSMGRERVEEAAEHLDFSLLGLRRAMSKNDPRLGLQLLTVSLLHAQIGNSTEAAKRAQEAAEIFELTDGAERPFYKLATRLQKSASGPSVENSFAFDDQMAAGLKILTGVLCCSLFPGCSR